MTINISIRTISKYTTKKSKLKRKYWLLSFCRYSKLKKENIIIKIFLLEQLNLKFLNTGKFLNKLFLLTANIKRKENLADFQKNSLALSTEDKN